MKNAPGKILFLLFGWQLLLYGVEVKQIVGSFRLDLSEIPACVDAYSEVDIIYTLHGRGAAPELPDLFSGRLHAPHRLYLQKLDDKERHLWRYRYAILAEHNLTIPAVTLHAYDPQKQQRYLLHANAHTICVEPIPAQEVLDKRDLPPASGFDPSWSRYMLYGALFFGGLILCGIWRKVRGSDAT